MFLDTVASESRICKDLKKGDLVSRLGMVLWISLICSLPVPVCSPSLQMPSVAYRKSVVWKMLLDLELKGGLSVLAVSVHGLRRQWTWCLDYPLACRSGSSHSWYSVPTSCWQNVKLWINRFLTLSAPPCFVLWYINVMSSFPGWRCETYSERSKLTCFGLGTSHVYDCAELLPGRIPLTPLGTPGKPWPSSGHWWLYSTSFPLVPHERPCLLLPSCLNLLL